MNKKAYLYKYRNGYIHVTIGQYIMYMYVYVVQRKLGMAHTCSTMCKIMIMHMYNDPKHTPDK